MISRYIVTLNGISLESLHPAIVVTDVKYPNVEYEREAIGSVRRDGARIHRTYKEKSEVSVSFMIREYDINNRQVICQSVCRWAKNGGRLMVNDRPLQFLDCVVDSFPAVESTRGWSDDLTITFAAYGIPFWQDLIPTEITPAVASTHFVYQRIPGNAQWAFVEAKVKASDTLTNFEIMIGSDRHNPEKGKFTVSGMALGAGDIMTITYDSNAVLKIYHWDDERYSMLQYHTGKDDLIAACDEVNQFNFSANCVCEVVYKVRGYWE